MIESEAQVVRVENEYAWVRVKPHTPCGQCDPESGCKSVALTRLFGGAQDFRVRNPVQAEPGDLVLVAVEDGLLLKSALWGYGLPLGLMLGGAAAGFFMAPAAWANSATLAGALLGAAGAFLLLRRRRLNQIEPQIVRKCEPGLPLVASTCKSKSPR